MNLQNHRTGSGRCDGVEAEAIVGDQIPAGLLENFQVAGIVDVPKRIEVPFANHNRLLEDAITHGRILGRATFFAKPTWNKAASAWFCGLSVRLGVRNPAETESHRTMYFDACSQ